MIVSLATAFNPLAGVLGAFLILGETPNTAQYLDDLVIFPGIILNQIGVYNLDRHEQITSITDKEISETIGFKGI